MLVLKPQGQSLSNFASHVQSHEIQQIPYVMFENTSQFFSVM